MSYKYEEIESRPFITPDSDIPETLLHFSHSFGYDCGRRANLQLLDDRTLIFIAGNLLILLDIPTKQQRFLRSCSGRGIGSITVHPWKEYFAVAEKGRHPNIIIYEYPSLRPYRILRGGTEQAYSSVDFNHEGSMLASVGTAPDFKLTLWDWRQEKMMLSCKVAGQDVYRLSFSLHNLENLTTSGSGHIKFWKMIETFTGQKLQGHMGHFGKTTPTDIEGVIELPDGKVVSGSFWGNLLLWDDNLIKVEICRKGGRSCHSGTIQPFTLEEGQLMTIGSDGAVRGWDFELIDNADSSDDSTLFEMEPMNEMMIGHNVSLSYMVKSSLPDSFVWFAQDSNGAIWQLDLSFTNTTPDPKCLFSFHAGPIQGLDTSGKSQLMATTALDRSVQVYDFLAKRQLTTSRFNQGGTAVSWAPSLVNQTGGLLVTGFEDGVVRLLELYDPRRLPVVTGRQKGDAELRLKQAFKPHNAPVTAVAYDRTGATLATGSSDCTVFFFAVGENYNPFGFIHVPGPVQRLEWSPQSHRKSTLLVLCQSGHVVEVQSPDPHLKKSGKSFHLPELPSRSFRFRSIKSRIQRDEEIARRRAKKEKKKEREEKLKEAQVFIQEEEEEEEGELPPIYIPESPSPLCCGFYSQPDQFWLSMGSFDSGFLYHCKISEDQDEDPDQRQDEPFDFRPVHNADDDPVCSVTFSSNRQLMLCGMHSGSIRVYPLQAKDHSLSSMDAYWSLSVHDNQYGPLKHIRCSHDDKFVLTAGEDGNIFSFSLIPPEELQLKKAKVPSPRPGLENKELAQDIEDPTSYSIETAKQRLEEDRRRRAVELKVAGKREKLAELQKKYRRLVNENQSLPAHVRLQPADLQLDRCFSDQAERLKLQRVMQLRKLLGWEEERSRIALKKLQDHFKDSLESLVVTVVAIHSSHSVTTYCLQALAEDSHGLSQQKQPAQSKGAAAQKGKKHRTEHATDKPEEDEVLRPPVVRAQGVKLADHQTERLRKAAEKAEQARAKIEKRKQEWAQLYAEKPDETWEDPEDVKAIEEARKNIGDLKLKSDKDFVGPKHLRMNTESKRAELAALEEKIHEKQTDMNGRIIALRDAKVRLVSRLSAQAQQLQQVQNHLEAHHHRHPPAVPAIQPEETPEKKLRCSRATLERYRLLRDQRFVSEDQEESSALLQQLEKEMEGEEEQETGGEETPKALVSSVSGEKEESSEEAGAELSDLEEQVRREEEIRALHEQDCLLEEMKMSTWAFDAQLRLLRHEKLRLDWELKMADLRHMTLCQELLLLEDFEKREESLQEKLSARLEEEQRIMSKLEESTEELEDRRRRIAKLQEREKALLAAFKASLGENHKFEDFLTRVFKKEIKRHKKNELTGEEEDEDSDEFSDYDDDDWDDNSGSEEGGPALDDSVCPPNCEPELFENTVQLRERRLDLEELLAEERKCADALKKERDALVKKEKVVQSSRKAAENDLQSVNREKQQKINELDVVVPLRLHQIEFVANSSVPSDMSSSLVLNRTELDRLQERIKELQVENRKQRDQYAQAHQQRIRLIKDNKDKEAKIQALEKQCNEQMMLKFGRLVDLEALQTLGGNRRLEELRQEKLIQEAVHAKELRQWDAQVAEAQRAFMEVTRSNTEYLFKMWTLIEEKRALEAQINAKQKKTGSQFQEDKRHTDNERLRESVKRKQQQVEALRAEIDSLSRKGGHVSPPHQPPLTSEREPQTH